MKPEEAIARRHPRSEVGLAEVLQASITLGVRGGPRAQWLAEALGLTWSEATSTAAPAAPGGSQAATSTRGSDTSAPVGART